MRIKLSWEEMERDMFKKKSEKHFVLNAEEHAYIVKSLNEYDLDPDHKKIYTIDIKSYVVLT